MALWWTGTLEIAESGSDGARIKLGRALRALRAFEMNSEMLLCIEDHAALLQSDGAIDEAVRLHGTVARSRERLRLVRPPRGEALASKELSAARERLGAAAFDTAWTEGRRWGVDEAISRALFLAGSRAIP